jgi:hypothetical protein
VGEQADLILNGEMCSWCGTMFEREHGHPVACDDCWENAPVSDQKNVQKAYFPEIS